MMKKKCDLCNINLSTDLANPKIVIFNNNDVVYVCHYCFHKRQLAADENVKVVYNFGKEK